MVVEPAGGNLDVALVNCTELNLVGQQQHTGRYGS